MAESKYEKKAFTKEDFRKEVAEKFVKLLDENNEVNPMSWVKEWQGCETPVNLSTGKPYNGINAVMLQIESITHGYTDPRWGTIKKVNSYEGAHVKRGEHGTKIEFDFAKDIASEIDGAPNPNFGKTFTWTEAFKICKENDRDINEFRNVKRYFTVFNAEQCEGLPEYIKDKNNDIEQDEFVNAVSKGMGVEVANDGGFKAFYSRKEDKVHLPEKETFTSEYAYNATALHELGHASGAEWRLNRTKGKSFGDSDYAFEELVAEITSCMASANLKSDEQGLDEYIKTHAENHMKYVKSWAESIKEKPDVLIDAVNLAETATQYLECCAGLETKEVFKRRNHKVDPKAIDNPTGLNVEFNAETNICSVERKGQKYVEFQMSVKNICSEEKVKDYTVGAAQKDDSFIRDEAYKQGYNIASMTKLEDYHEWEILASKLTPYISDIIKEGIEEYQKKDIDKVSAEEQVPVEAMIYQQSVEL